MANASTRKETKVSRPVCVIGGGWAGLSCSLHLAQHNIPVRLMEAAPQLGGRARSVPGFKSPIDNGQHLFIGAYHGLRELLSLLNLDEKSLFTQTPCRWIMKKPGKELSLKVPTLPAPLHGLLGTFLAKGMSLKDKWQLIRFCAKLKTLKAEGTVSELLNKSRLSPPLIQHFFEPLCLAALSTPAHIASGAVFVQVLKDTFFNQQQDSHFWFAKKDLSEVLPNPAHHYLENLGHKVHVNARVEHITIEHGQALGVSTKNQWFEASAVVLATPYWSTAKLIKPHPVLHALHEQCSSFNSESITTVYCQFSPNIRLEAPLIGLTESVSQWVFDRSFAHQPGLIAVVITGNTHGMSNDRLCAQVLQELQQHFPQCNEALQTRVIHEKRGAFTCSVDNQNNRPGSITPVHQLFLTGDYCHNLYPATLEGAVLNGKQCAQEVLKRVHYDHSITPVSICA